MYEALAVTIVLVEDDPGHARLIEKNLRRAHITNDIVTLRDGQEAIEYFFKAPSDLSERLVIVVVPILATANTAVAAVDRLKERGGKEIRLVCLISAPQGIERMRGAHPDVPIWTAAIDESLDERAFIVPGLGDAGDRAYGTK